MKDDLAQIPEIIKIGRSTLNIIKQNIFMWGVLNIIGFALVFTHVLNPSGAAAYNFISDFISCQIFSKFFIESRLMNGIINNLMLKLSHNCFLMASFC
jgi:hypothetical protein